MRHHVAEPALPDVHASGLGLATPIVVRRRMQDRFNPREVAIAGEHDQEHRQQRDGGRPLRLGDPVVPHQQVPRHRQKPEEPASRTRQRQRPQHERGGRSQAHAAQQPGGRPPQVHDERQGAHDQHREIVSIVEQRPGAETTFAANRGMRHGDGGEHGRSNDLNPRQPSQIGQPTDAGGDHQHQDHAPQVVFEDEAQTERGRQASRNRRDHERHDDQRRAHERLAAAAQATPRVAIEREQQYRDHGGEHRQTQQRHASDRPLHPPDLQQQQYRQGHLQRIPTRLRKGPRRLRVRRSRHGEPARVRHRGCPVLNRPFRATTGKSSPNVRSASSYPAPRLRLSDCTSQNPAAARARAMPFSVWTDSILRRLNGNRNCFPRPCRATPLRIAYVWYNTSLSRRALRSDKILNAAIRSGCSIIHTCPSARRTRPASRSATGTFMYGIATLVVTSANTPARNGSASPLATTTWMGELVRPASVLTASRFTSTPTRNAPSGKSRASSVEFSPQPTSKAAWHAYVITGTPEGPAAMVSAVAAGRASPVLMGTPSGARPVPPTDAPPTLSPFQTAPRNGVAATPHWWRATGKRTGVRHRAHVLRQPSGGSDRGDTLLLVWGCDGA